MMKDEETDQKCHPLSTTSRSAMGFPLFDRSSGRNLVGLWRRFVKVFVAVAVAVASDVMVGMLGVFRMCYFGVLLVQYLRRRFASRLMRERRIVVAIASLTTVATGAANSGSGGLPTMATFAVIVDRLTMVIKKRFWMNYYFRSHFV